MNENPSRAFRSSHLINFLIINSHRLPLLEKKTEANSSAHLSDFNFLIMRRVCFLYSSRSILSTSSGRLPFPLIIDSIRSLYPALSSFSKHCISSRRNRHSIALEGFASFNLSASFVKIHLISPSVSLRISMFLTSEIYFLAISIFLFISSALFMFSSISSWCEAGDERSSINAFVEVPSVIFIYRSFLSNFFVFDHHLLHASSGTIPSVSLFLIFDTRSEE